MKKLILVVLAILFINFYALAEGAPRKGAFGLQTALTFTGTGLSPVGSFGGKYFITDPIALRGALGFANDSTGTGYDIAAGFEYHFSGKGGVSPYAGAQISYSGGSLAGGGNAATQFGLNGVFGAEYFFSNNFSWAGEAQLGFYSSYNGATTNTLLTTAEALFIITWYIN